MVTFSSRLSSEILTHKKTMKNIFYQHAMFILSLYPSRVLVGGSASSIWARIPGIFLVGLKVVSNGIHEREGVTVDICTAAIDISTNVETSTKCR